MNFGTSDCRILVKMMKKMIQSRVIMMKPKMVMVNLIFQQTMEKTMVSSPLVQSCDSKYT